MQGMSERDYAARAGLSRGAIQKAKTAGRLVLHPDGSIDADASDARRAAATDPSKQRGGRAPERSAERPPSTAGPKLKPVPNAAVAAVAVGARPVQRPHLEDVGADERRAVLGGDGAGEEVGLGEGGPGEDEQEEE